MRKKIAVVFGTRPDAIKMAPILLEQNNFPQFDLVPISSGQHKEMLQSVLELFRVTPAFDAGVMATGQSLDQLTTKVILGLGKVFDTISPELVLVHGDTTTGFGAALAAFYRQIPVGHVEAGLRTATLDNPFPEEMNRRCIDKISSFHFAPTDRARDNLLAENIPSEGISVTGNTIVDALSLVRAQTSGSLQSTLSAIDKQSRLILLTTHRRENIGDGMRNIFKAVKEILSSHPEAEVIFPIHMNAAVREVAVEILGGVPRVHIVEPVDYREMVAILIRAEIMLTDSGGLQEEAPSFGKPLLVLRETTERPEVIEAGWGILVGTDKEKIVKNTDRLLSDSKFYQRMTSGKNPYGEPGVAGRILEFIDARLR